MPVVNRARACLLAIGIAALTTGCAVGPDFERPEAPEVEGYAREPLPGETAKADIAGGETQRFVQDLDIPGQWWTLFHSEALNALIEQALRNNPTLPAAEAALRLAWENVYAGEGAFFPTAIAGYSPSRNKTATGVVTSVEADELAPDLLHIHRLNPVGKTRIAGENRSPRRGATPPRPPAGSGCSSAPARSGR